MLTAVDQMVVDAAKAKVTVAIEEITQSLEAELNFARGLASSLDQSDVPRIVDLAKEINSLGVRGLWRATNS